MEIQVKIENVTIHVSGMDESGSLVTTDRFKTELESLYKSISALILNSEARSRKFIKDSASVITISGPVEKHQESKAYEPEPKAITGAKICTECGKEYKPTGNAQQRCPECIKKITHPRTDKEVRIAKKTCLECGQSYTPRGNSQRYCSDECKTKAQKKLASKYNKTYNAKKKLTPQQEKELDEALAQVKKSESKTYEFTNK